MIRLLPQLVSGVFLMYCLVNPLFTFSQTSPYQLSPKWIVGDDAQIDFTSGAPVYTNVTSGISGAEGTSTICDSLKNIAVCSDNYRVAGNNLVAHGTTMTSSRSSTQGGLILPDPANPYARFYIGAGSAEVAVAPETANAGLRLYATNKSGATVTAPTQIAILDGTGGIKESVYSSVDGDWGYWLITAYGGGGSGANTYYSYSIPETGGPSTTAVTSTGGTNWNPQYQSSVKISRCQDKVAFVSGSVIEIRNWNRTTGTVGTQIYYNSTNPAGTSKYYSVEFSPNGNYAYANLLVNPTAPYPIVVINLTGTPTMTTLGATPIGGTLQVAPDGNIYVSNGTETGSTVVARITNANTGGTLQTNAITFTGSGSKYLGLANIAWLNPRKPTIGYSLSSCVYTFTPSSFLTYFKDPVSYDQAIWDFGDGTATVTNNGAAADDPVNHSYTSTGNKTITLTLRSTVCQHQFSNTRTINVTCALPVELIRFTGYADNGVVKLNWATATEINNKNFEIQRSLDGITFETIGYVDGQGNSYTQANYSFTDNTASGEKIYYRLIQHDYDGKSTSSNTIAVHLSGLQLMLAPNPSSEEFFLSIANGENGFVTVYNMLGVEVFKTETSDSNAAFAFGKDFNKGYYILKYTSNSETRSIKIQKF